MSFLKNYYEKVILVFLLIAFIVLLVVQIRVLLQTQQLVINRLINIPEPPPDYILSVDDTKPEYNKGLIFGLSDEWKTPIASRDLDHPTANIMTPSKLAECPTPGCKKLILVSRFPATEADAAKNPSFHRCPFCSHALPALQAKVVVIDNDTNKNGVPDDLELKWGLNLDDPGAVNTDGDGDGFSFLEEFQAKTDPMNAQSHPPFALKLYLDKIKELPLNMIVKGISYRNSEEPAKWRLQLEVVSTSRRIYPEPKIGDTVPVPVEGSKDAFVEYKILSVQKVLVKNESKLGIFDDCSIVTFEQKNGSQQIKAIVGKTIFDPRESYVLYDAIADKNIVCYKNDKIILGNKTFGEEEYILAESDKRIPAVTVKRVKDGKEFVLPLKSSRVDVPKENDGNLPDGIGENRMMPPAGPTAVTPPRRMTLPPRGLPPLPRGSNSK